MTYADKSIELYFPTLVWRFEFAPEDRDAINGAVVELFETLSDGDIDLKYGGALQTDTKLHLVPAMEPMVRRFDQAIREVLDTLEVIYERVRITGCWANVNAVHARHPEHVHPNNYLSGVYYVQADEGADTFTIDDPRPQRAMIRPRVRETNTANASRFTLKVKPGDLLLFPAWLPHSVDYNKSRRARISVSFNAMFEDFARGMSPPDWDGQLSTESLRGKPED